MEWIDRLNETMDYIEAHLTEEISYEELARRACCSVYHYQRMISYMAGVPLAEYIRRRRMSLAAAELSAGAKVLDVALKYGYQSPTAFNRAFQAIHGVTPSAAKETGVGIKSFPPLRFQITVTGGAALEYRIEKKEAFRVVGLAATLDHVLEKNFETVPGLWQRAAEEGLVPRLAALMNGAPAGLLGVSACGDDEAWKYMIAVSSDAPVEKPLEEYTVPAFTWAVFPGAGTCPQAIQALERRIVTEWLPTSGYEYAEGPDVEVYLNPECTRFEVWIPVVKANG